MAASDPSMSRLAGAVLAILVATLATAAAVRPAFACSCAAMTPAEALAQSDAAFVGTVVNAPPIPGLALPAKEPGQGPLIDPIGGAAVPFTFAVEGVAKGDVAQPATVMGGSDSAMCGMAFAPEERWLVFAMLQEGALTTNLCSGSVLLAPEEAPPVSVTPVESVPGPAGFSVPAPLLVAGGAFALVLAASYLAFRRRPER